MPGRISRRSAVGLMSAGGLASALAGAGSSAEPAPAGSSLAPLQAGFKFGRWTIDAVHPVRDGVLRVDVHGADEKRFTLEVMARDASPLALQPPARTDGLAIYVRNGGDGWLPTAEEQGLAAMTLADVLTLHQKGGAVAGLLTHADRVTTHGETLMGEDPRLAARRG
jgi:hypothetical protein